MKITILEPYFTGSHASWARGYAASSRHEISMMTMPGRHWKWRMHGGAVSLAQMFREESPAPSMILATDMLDLATFHSLASDQLAGARSAVYFHENQLTYPWPENDPDTGAGRDAHYGFINYTSALAADAVLFNSDYHRKSFLRQLGPFLSRFPDFQLRDTADLIRDKSSVLHLGVDLKGLEEFREDKPADSPPLILWNHRWEYDKNPEEFFRALFILADEGVDFRVAVLGESFGESPSVFSEAREKLAGRLVRFGYAPERSEYASWLWRSDILPVTSVHDFFGAGVVEALYCNCCPVLPDRLVYPEHLPASVRERFLYCGFDRFLEMLRMRIERIDETRKVQAGRFVGRYDWERVSTIYDSFFEELAGNEPG
jgi:glycosyltransferase involved in cell wall biosynthesis